MKALFEFLEYRHSLRKALMMALLAGVITGIVVPPYRNHLIWSVAEFLGGTGNDLFLIFSNFLIIAWAWRKRLTSVIKLTLTVDLSVWLFVQGIKLLHLEPWYLRPNGGTGGFPSGHATHSFAMAFLLTLYFPRFAWIWYSWAAAISWARVETDWHTGFQVCAGIVLGLTLVWALVNRWLLHPEATIIQSPLTGQKVPRLRRHQSYVAE